MLFGQFTRGVVPGIRKELAQARGPTDLRAASAKPFPQPGGVLRKARGVAAQRPDRSFIKATFVLQPASARGHLLAPRINGHVSKHLNIEVVEGDLRPREGDLMKAAPFALPAKNRAERIVPFCRELRCSD